MDARGGAGLIADRGRRGRGSSDDRINELSEVLLSDILSRLGTAEAARTVVLSTRFRDAWLATPLRLDDLELPPRMRQRPSIQPDGADVATRPSLPPRPGQRFHLSGPPSLADAAETVPAITAKHAREVSSLLAEWCHDAAAAFSLPNLRPRPWQVPPPTPGLGRCRCPHRAHLPETCISRLPFRAAFPAALQCSLVLKHANGLQQIRSFAAASLAFGGGTTRSTRSTPEPELNFQ
ncbi:hypothetical protein ZWY2020_010541 [Hordeum vulgare]|nr:hypothetical protein ZWY2020_010541 [Hordeum vulgare]